VAVAKIFETFGLHPRLIDSEEAENTKCRPVVGKKKKKYSLYREKVYQPLSIRRKGKLFRRIDHDESRAQQI
jgi:hypothetical protein